MLDLSSKESVARAWRLGAFGNKLKSWMMPGEVPRDLVVKNYDQPWLALRSLKPGGPFQPYLFWERVLKVWTPAFYICEVAPHKDGIVQGEIMRDVGGLYLIYSFEKVPLRQAMNDIELLRHEMRGFAVNVYLQSVMSPESWIELSGCLDLHPDAVVEFTVFNRCVGDRPGRNTILWEVRLF